MVSHPEGVQRLTAVARGRVQGVGFRFFVLDHARAAGVVGFVRNLPDRRGVEVVAEGLTDQLERLLREIESGPAGAKVEFVDASWAAPTGQFVEFRMEV